MFNLSCKICALLLSFLLFQQMREARFFVLLNRAQAHHQAPSQQGYVFGPLHNCWLYILEVLSSILVVVKPLLCRWHRNSNRGSIQQDYMPCTYKIPLLWFGINRKAAIYMETKLSSILVIITLFFHLERANPYHPGEFTATVVATPC